MKNLWYFFFSLFNFNTKKKEWLIKQEQKLLTNNNIKYEIKVF